MIREELIEKYLEHKLSEDEMRVFERHISENPELQDAVLHYKSIIIAIQQAGRTERLKKLAHIPPYPTLVERLSYVLHYPIGIIVLIISILAYYLWQNYAKDIPVSAPKITYSPTPTANNSIPRLLNPAIATTIPKIIEVKVETLRLDSMPAPSTTLFIFMQDSSLKPFSYNFLKDTIRINPLEIPIRVFLLDETETYYLQLNQKIYRFKPYISDGLLEIETDTTHLKRISLNNFTRE